MNKIDRLLDEMEEFIEGRRASFGSSRKVTVIKDDLLEYVDRLKVNVPEELKMAKIVLDNESEILEKANRKAMEIIEAAKEEAERILDESSLVEQAYDRADEIIANAEAEANRIVLSANSDATEIRTGALSYSSDMIEEIEKIFTKSYRMADESFKNTLDTLKYNIDVLNHNRKLILRELEPYGEEVNPTEEPDEGELSEDFTVSVSPEDFLEEGSEEE